MRAKRISAPGPRILPLADGALLLDTHVFAWWLVTPGQIDAETREMIGRHPGRVLVSVASIWEMAQKHRRGRWPEVAAIVADPANWLTAAQMIALPISLTHATLAGTLDWPHRDSFDRMLAAQAILEGALLVTADRVFESMPPPAGLRTVWA